MKKLILFTAFFLTLGFNSLSQLANSEYYNTKFSRQSINKEKQELVKCKDNFYFITHTAAFGKELWRTNGKGSGVMMVKDINPGTKTSNPSSLIVINEVLFFVADDGIHGIEIWKSDGSSEGTVMIKDITRGRKSSNPVELKSVGGVLQFLVIDEDNIISKWKSDGTAEGTDLIIKRNSITDFETNCNNGIDDDADGQIDCLDSDCPCYGGGGGGGGGGGEGNAPDVTNEYFDICQNSNIAGNALINDFDQENDPLSVGAMITEPTKGVFTIDEEGNFNYQPNPGETGMDAVIFEVCDNVTGCSEELITFYIVSILPPIVINDTLIITMNSNITGTVINGDTDADGNSLTMNLTALKNPTNGAIELFSTGSYEFTPTAGFIGLDTAVVELCDFIGCSCKSDTVLITVTAISTLPLRLISFVSYKQGNANILQWKTANEVNSKEFVLERSTDGKKFSNLSLITAKGNGNNSYLFKEINPPVGSRGYYRLKMIDQDGWFTFSNIIQTTMNESSRLMIYPNPVHDKATIQLSDRKLINTKALLTDLSGKLIKNIQFNQTIEAVDMTGLLPGVYLLQIEGGTNFRIIKE